MFKTISNSASNYLNTTVSTIHFPPETVDTSFANPLFNITEYLTGCCGVKEVYAWRFDLTNEEFKRNFIETLRARNANTFNYNGAAFLTFVFQSSDQQNLATPRQQLLFDLVTSWPHTQTGWRKNPNSSYYLKVVLVSPSDIPPAA